MDGYSRLIAWLKVLLPMMALAILSTLFLLSRNTDPVAAIPFAEADIRDRLENRQITEPFFSGTTKRGDLVSISASQLRTPGQVPGEGTAENISAQFDLTSGMRVIVLSDAGALEEAGTFARLEGDVVMTTSTGFRMTTRALEAETERLYILSPGDVAGTGPFGTLDAGRMVLEAQKGRESPHLFFSEGVRLVYEPGEVQK